jgi:hypothetical protein
MVTDSISLPDSQPSRLSGNGVAPRELTGMISRIPPICWLRRADAVPTKNLPTTQKVMRRTQGTSACYSKEISDKSKSFRSIGAKKQ